MVESEADHAVIGIDLEGRILSWNAGRRGYLAAQRKKLSENTFPFLFTPEDRQSGVPERELEIARTRGGAEDFCWQMREDGSHFWASGYANQLRDEAGNLIGYVKVAHGATDKKLAEEQLKEALARDQPALFHPRFTLQYQNAGNVWFDDFHIQSTGSWALPKRRALSAPATGPGAGVWRGCCLYLYLYCQRQICAALFDQRG